MDCAFNFQCDRSERRCLVSSCQLTDDYDLIVNERTECLFDDDCLFFAPFDKGNWGCVEICSGDELACRKCKRCPSEPREKFNETSLWLIEVLTENVTLPPIPP